jgi:hypothetical protein
MHQTKIPLVRISKIRGWPAGFEHAYSNGVFSKVGNQAYVPCLSSFLSPNNHDYSPESCHEKEERLEKERELERIWSRAEAKLRFEREYKEYKTSTPIETELWSRSAFGIVVIYSRVECVKEYNTE